MSEKMPSFDSFTRDTGEMNEEVKKDTEIFFRYIMNALANEYTVNDNEYLVCYFNGVILPGFKTFTVNENGLEGKTIDINYLKSLFVRGEMFPQIMNHITNLEVILPRNMIVPFLDPKYRQGTSKK